MRLRLLALSAAVAIVSPLIGRADVGQVPTAATSPQNRSVDPVVMTGNQFPSWSAGADPTLHEPASPLNSSTVNQQGLEPQQLQSQCYAPGVNPYDPADNGDHSCVQDSRIPHNPNVGADVNRIVGYRWESATSSFVQVPLQVDEKFTRYITNNASGFAFYSGTDAETNYAFDREGFRYSSDQSRTTAGGDSCLVEPAPGSPALNAKGYSAQSDPVKGLDDNDEIAFMYSDAGADIAPPTTALPSGVASAYRVAVADPSNPSIIRFIYVMLATTDLNPGSSTQTISDWNAAHSYVRYTRDANADIFQYSQSSYGNYGAAPKGPYCTPNDVPSTAHGAIAQRRPLDTAWITTPRYAFRYDGRWLMTQLRISQSDNGALVNGAPANYGADIMDQWKARAFQQRPGGNTPCCGYEEEVNNWGGSSILFGERWGSVRAIRAAWGADSSTNNIKTETFYRDTITFGDNLRVHVIPPLDGIYVQWDYNAGKVATYYNPWQPQGVAVDGRNDEVFGNTQINVTSGGAQFKDGDPVPVVGPQDQTIGNPDLNNCDINCNDIDVSDPTFDGPAGTLNWEEVAGSNGGVVTRWAIKQHTGGDAYTLLATPYYRDDSCFDDGTGSDPGLHQHSRNVDDGAYAFWTDGNGVKHPRECWDVKKFADPSLDPDAKYGKYYQGDIATHGLHLNLIADSDNAYQTVPIDEVDSEQRMVVLPASIVNPGGSTANVGEQYGRSIEYPFQISAVPFA